MVVSCVSPNKSFPTNIQLTINYMTPIVKKTPATRNCWVPRGTSIRRVTVNMGMSMPSWFDINSLEPELFKLNPPGLKDQIAARKFHGRNFPRMRWEFRARSFLVFLFVRGGWWLGENQKLG